MATGRQEWLRSLILVPAWASVAIGAAGFPGNYLFAHNGKPDVFLSPEYSGAILLCGALLLAGRFRPKYSTGLGLASIAILSLSHGVAWLRDARQYARATADDAAREIVASVSHLMALIQRMGERWSVIDTDIGERLLEREFSTYLRDYSTVGKIDLMLADGTVLASRERLGYAEQWLSPPTSLDVFHEWLGTVASSREAQLAPFHRQKVDGLWGMIGVRAGYFGDTPRIVVARVNLIQVVELTLAGNETLAQFQVQAGDTPVYVTDKAYSRIVSTPVLRSINISEGIPWRLTSHSVSRDSSWLGATMDALPLIILVIGFAFTLVMSASLRFAQIARHRTVELETAALTDGLTGLPNREGAARALKSAMHKSRHEGYSIGVISLSLGGIDLITDSFGHSTGDALLQEVSARIQTYVAGNGSVARHGDNDFIVLHERSSADALQAFTSQLTELLHRPFYIAGNTLRLSACAGFTLWNGSDADPMQLVRQADLAMLDCKIGGHISPRYFRRDNFVSRVEAVLANASLEPDGLQIEITEGVFLENEEDAIVKLRALRKIGIKTAIDDFGTGYSSLSYLKNLPVDKIKIDRSFVTDIVTNMPAAGIIRGIISMVHHLKLKVVAEGVETQGQYCFLRGSQCDEYQGYLFARPMSFDDLVSALSRNEGRYALPSAEVHSAVCSSHDPSDKSA